MNRSVAAVGLATLLGLGAGCGTDDGDSATTTAPPDATAEPSDDAVDLSSLESYDDLAALQEAIIGAGRTCELEYEGLEDSDKTLSICVIEGEQATLTIWNDSADVEALVGADLDLELVAYGANWTIDVATPENAQAVAVALGGASG